VGAAAPIPGEKLMSVLPFLAGFGLTASSNRVSDQSENTTASMNTGRTLTQPTQ
jgi:hypothetical protein